jgi:hypothetical protein
MGGSAIAIIDNVTGEEPIESPSLAAVLTTNTWEDRILGRSEMVRLPARTTWIMTGNNIRVAVDLSRRSVWCHMNARVARPWTREGFRHPDLLAWVREHRGELLAAVFTVARAWISAGRVSPDSRVPRLGSFESWRDVIGGMLEVAGIPGFLANLEEHYNDSTSREWGKFLSALCEIYGDQPMRVAEISGRLIDIEDQKLLEALPHDLVGAIERPASLGKRLGKAFANNADQRFTSADGETTVRIVKAGESRGSVLWRVIEE